MSLSKTMMKHYARLADGLVENRRAQATKPVQPEAAQLTLANGSTITGVSTALDRQYGKLMSDTLRGYSQHWWTNTTTGTTSSPNDPAIYQRGLDIMQEHMLATGSAPMPEPKQVEGPPVEIGALPVEAEPVPAGVSTEEYLELASKLGYSAREMKVRIFRSFLQEQEIAVYPLAAVYAYMDAEVAKRNAARRPGARAIKWDWTALCVYPHALPVEGLRIAARIAAFPGQTATEKVGFEVTDYAVVRPDPFLACFYLGERFAFFKWDEPGFSVLGDATSTS